MYVFVVMALYQRLADVAIPRIQPPRPPKIIMRLLFLSATADILEISNLRILSSRGGFVYFSVAQVL